MKQISSEKGFLGLKVEQSPAHPLHQAWILPFSFERNEELGCRIGPQAIIHASHEINLFDERFGGYPFKQIQCITAQEISKRKRISQAVLEFEQWQSILADKEQFALTLGGEGSLTLQGLSPWFNKKNFAFIHIGAQGQILYDLAKQYSEALFIGFGVRNLSESLYQLEKQAPERLMLFYTRNKKNWDWSKIKSQLSDKIIYLSISADCFDMGLFPATPSPEPGGLGWDDLIECIENLTHCSAVVGACLADFSPIERKRSYDLLMAKLVYRILATVFLST